MVSAGLAAALLVLLPAMLFVWVYLRRYEGHFDQNRLFFVLVVGLFAGIAIRFLEVALFPFDNPCLTSDPQAAYRPGVGCIGPAGTSPLGFSNLVYSFAYASFGLALLQSLGKTAVLGFRKFRSRTDSAYHGVALGFGFGAMWTMQVVAARLPTVEGQLATSQEAVVYTAFLFLLAIGLLLSHAASAVWIGRGAGAGRLWKGAVHGTLWMAPALALYWLWINTGDQVLPALGAVGWGVFAMGLANRRVLQPLIPPEVREASRKQRRREARKAALGEPAKPK